VIVNLIANTHTSKGLTIQADLNVNSYAKGIKVSKEEMSRLNFKPADFHGEWNYTIFPSKWNFIWGKLFLELEGSLFSKKLLHDSGAVAQTPLQPRLPCRPSHAVGIPSAAYRW
jgi:hypothetical protein